MDLWTHVVMYELVDVIYMCYICAPLSSVPGNCARQLGKIFTPRVFPALPSVVAQGARQRKFLKK
jgi:hypothetical protein